jgi:hypothetical protein
VGGIDEHVIPGQTGLLINSGSEEQIVTDFVQAISGMYADRALLNTYSTNCHAYALQHFGKQQFTDAYRNLLLNKKA